MTSDHSNRSFSSLLAIISAIVCIFFISLFVYRSQHSSVGMRSVRPPSMLPLWVYFPESQMRFTFTFCYQLGKLSIAFLRTAAVSLQLAAQAGNVVSSGKHIHMPPRASAALEIADVWHSESILWILLSRQQSWIFGCCVAIAIVSRLLRVAV